MSLFSHHSGDVVHLKSGGPSMTVDKKFPSGTIVCAWFETISVNGKDQQICQRQSFRASTLEPIT